MPFAGLQVELVPGCRQQFHFADRQGKQQFEGRRRIGWEVRGFPHRLEEGDQLATGQDATTGADLAADVGPIERGGRIGCYRGGVSQPFISFPTPPPPPPPPPPSPPPPTPLPSFFLSSPPPLLSSSSPPSPPPTTPPPPNPPPPSPQLNPLISTYLSPPYLPTPQFLLPTPKNPLPWRGHKSLHPSSTPLPPPTYPFNHFPNLPPPSLPSLPHSKPNPYLPTYAPTFASFFLFPSTHPYYSTLFLHSPFISILPPTPSPSPSLTPPTPPLQFTNTHHSFLLIHLFQTTLSLIFTSSPNSSLSTHY